LLHVPLFEVFLTESDGFANGAISGTLLAILRSDGGLDSPQVLAFVNTVIPRLLFSMTEQCLSAPGIDVVDLNNFCEIVRLAMQKSSAVYVFVCYAVTMQHPIVSHWSFANPILG
jgi:hypothetical protein